MKKSLYDIFEENNSKELYDLIDEAGFELPESVSLEEIDKKVINNIELKNVERRARKRKLIILIAASFALLIALSIGTAYAIEIREYNEAVTYFNKNNLSTEGLSRSEIKEVYHDISTESFSNSKTPEVLQNSKIKGYEIIQDNTDSEELRNLWENSNVISSGTKDDVYYQYNTNYGEDKWMYDDEGYEFGYSEIDSSYITKYRNGSLEWMVDFKEFSIDGYKETDEGVIVYGSTVHMYGEKPQRAWAALINNDGTVRWKKEIGDEFVSETVENITESGGQITIISSADNQEKGGINSYFEDKSDEPIYMMFTVLDRSGKTLKRIRNKQDGTFVINNLIAVDSGYLAEIIYPMDETEDIQRICKINKEGIIEQSYKINSKNSKLSFTDMFENNGKLYISAVSRPTKSIYEKIDDDISDKKLLPYVKEEYTALLLLCDSQSVSPKKFYSVNGAFAGSLKADEYGNMIWSVDKIVTSTYSPMTNAYSISGLEKRYEYKFDKNGKILSEGKTGAKDIYLVH